MRETQTNSSTVIDICSSSSTIRPIDLSFSQNTKNGKFSAMIEKEKDPMSLISNEQDIKQYNTTSSSSISQNNKPNGCVKVIKCHNQIKELLTVIRDCDTSHSDFKFYSDRLIRLLVEQGLNEIPYDACQVTTPVGCLYDGVRSMKSLCGVSIMRSGEAMEKGLRECCRSIRIGKILIQKTENVSHAVYAKLPQDIHLRKILLMYPITATGSTVSLAIQTLKEHGVSEEDIIVLCLIVTPIGLQAIQSSYPHVDIVTTEIHVNVPADFGQRYFGTAE